MQGRLENQLKTEKKINEILTELPKEVEEYYVNISTSKEFRTCLSYVQKLRRFLRWYCDKKENKDLRKMDFSKVSDGDIAKYLKYVEIKQDADGNVSFTTFSYRKQIYSILNGFFEFLYKKRYVQSNPVSLLDRPTKMDKVEHIFLKEKDVNGILEAINNGAGNTHAIHRQEQWKNRDLAIFYTFIFTGMRESALCEIDINKIDFENNRIDVIDKEHKHNTYNITPKLKSILSTWIDDRKELLGNIDTDAFFISNQRKRINQGTVRAIINKYSQEALGYKVSPHRLRAAFGNMIYEETGDIELTSRAMKHANISTTRIYMENDEKKVNKQIADILGSKF